MKRYSYYSLLVLLFMSLACGAQGTSPEPVTVQPESTETPAPTDTPFPTETPTPLPTVTPDVEATVAVRATDSASDVFNELGRLLDASDVAYQDGHLAWQQTDEMNIQLSGPDFAIVGIDEDLTAGDFIFKSDVTWEATGLLFCGAVFRSEPNLEEGKQYQFVFLRLSGLPAWTIEVHEFGYYKNSPTDVRTSQALDLRNGATNQFVLVVQDDNFTLYLNEVRQGKYYDYSMQRTNGAIGFMGYQDSGSGMCKFENSWVWSLD
ncbi:MAG: hypothetical protein R3307_03555 [Anaerolineales bacterium]|nr:hypothetical protein [Anaerolineales bacterium]